MSHPPGGPGWQGQQGQWQAPPPQYPQQHYPPQQYPQQQWGQQQWGPPQPPPPPPKSRTGLYVGLAAVAVLALAAVGVTGFVTPGFFLSDDEPAAAAPPPQQSKSASPKPSSPKTTTPSTAGADPVVTEFVAKLNAKDAAGASALVCKGAEQLSKEAIDRATTGSPDLKADKVTTKTGISADLGGTLNGKKAVGFVALTETSNKWCVSNVFVFAG